MGSTRWSCRSFRQELCSRGLLHDPRFHRQETVRLSQVPVLSLCRYALVYDPGGLLPNSPLAFDKILRSNSMRLSAFATGRSGDPPQLIPFGTTTFKQLSRLNTGPTDLLHPAPDVRLLPPAGFTAGLVANLCPGRNFTFWITSTNFIEAANPESQGYEFNLARQTVVRGLHVTSQPVVCDGHCTHQPN
jgi:hypothetical protein